MIGVIGIILSLGLLMYLAYKGVSVIILAPCLALLATCFGLFQGESVHLLATYTEQFMGALAGYVKSYFPIFMLGAIFGKIMDDTGAAKSIAAAVSGKLGKSQAILAVVISCAIITYGGVSLFVAVFAIYPIGAELFKEAGIPKRFLPGAIALGAFTFTMTAVPGTPQIQNAIPMKYLGTDAYAAPILGIVAAVIMFVGGVLWLTWRSKIAMAAGEDYGVHDEHFELEDADRKLPPFILSIAPVVLVIVTNFIFSRYVFKDMDAAYLEEYGTTLSAVIGNWSLIMALVISVIFSLVVFRKQFKSILQSLKDGVQGSFLAVMNTASEVGYGNVIAGLTAYGVITAFITGISSNPLVGTAITSSVMAGVTGSASGGLSIALETMGDQFLAAANASGLSPEAIHRVAAVACGGLDTLPHNGAVITLLGITGMTHKQSYLHIGMCTVVIPSIAVVTIIILGSMGIC